MLKGHVITDPVTVWISGLLKAHEYNPPLTPPSPKYQKRFYVLISNPKLHSEENKFREVFKITKCGLDSFDEGIKWGNAVYADIKIKNKYETELKKLMINFKIGNRWRKPVEYYLLFNEENVDHLLRDPISLGTKIVDGELEMYLNIYKDTTKQDIDDIWAKVKETQLLLGRMKDEAKFPIKENTGKVVTPDKQNKKIWAVSPTKAKRRKKIDDPHDQFSKYEKATKLSQQGMKYDDIAKELGWKKSDQGKVGTYIANFKKEIENNELF